MRLLREKQTLLLLLNAVESRLLKRVFDQLTEQYRLQPGDIDPKTAAVWYSTRGCVTANLSEQETRDWLEQIHRIKSTNVEQLEKWRRQLTLSPVSLRVGLDHASAFVTVLNDRRLWVAAMHDIGQDEMDVQSPLPLVKLPANQQEALLEMHMLAWIIEETLRALSDWYGPEAAPER